MKKLFVARQTNLFEKFANPYFEIPEDYKIIDAVLEDEAIVTELAQDFPDALTGRNRTPVEQTLRFLVLKHQKALSYRDLEQTLKENLADRWFCKINEYPPVFKTLQNQIARIQEKTIHAINTRILQEARRRKMTKGKRMRVDSTVSEANIHYPTDASLLADAMRVVARSVRENVAVLPRGFRTFKRRIKQEMKLIRTIGRRNKEVRDRAVHELMRMGKHIAVKARQIRDTQVHRGREILERVITQTKAVLNGEKVKNRIVSVFDLSARAIPKGKAGKPCEFGQEVQIQEDERFITHWQIHNRPNDEGFFTQALLKHEELYGYAPDVAATDRGYWSVRNQEAAVHAGVTHISIPKKGKLNEEEQVRQSTVKFKELQRWRSGGEAKISWLKRTYKIGKCRYQGATGMALWVGAGILACNVATIARVALAHGVP